MRHLKRALAKRFGPTVVEQIKFHTYGDEEFSWIVAKIDDFVVGLHIGDVIFVEGSR